MPQIPLSEEEAPQSWVHEARAEGEIMQAPGLPKPLDAGIPPPCNGLAGLRAKHL